MAAEQWLEIYRSYELEELDAEITQLQKDVRGSFSGQGQGSVNHTRDLAELRDRLQAATRVRNDRNGPGRGTMRVGQVDFSGNRW